VGRTVDFGETQFWTRVNALDSPWGLDDLVAIVPEIGHALDVIMIPKVEGPEDIHYVDRLLAQLEAKAGLTRPILVHAILETARGVANVEEICAASPRMQGLSLGPADLAANRRMKTTRVGGGHPGYLVRQDPVDGDIDGPRATYQQDLWHYTVARMAVTIQASRQASYAVARLMAKGEGTLEAAMVKAYVCKAAEWVTREAMQIHGGMGYAEEYDVSRYFVDARVLSIFEGADELLCLRVIARRLIEGIAA
jgi:citrate lyase beta subunit